MTPSTHLVTDPFSAVADAARARGARRVLIVCGPSRRFVDRLLPGLAFAEVEVFDRAQAHVPVEVVEAAEARRAAFDPDLVVAIGGGAATGLAKILRVRHGLSFFALPTTLAGSEMTSIHGLTRGRTKETGRDERARPDAVFHAPELLRALPRRSLLQSLFNALAHPVSALSAGLEGEAERAAAREAIGSLTSSAFHLAQAPGHGAALEAALGGAARAGEILDRGPLGAHHRIAHRLGGRFALPHAALHALLLPHTLRDLRDAQPDTFREIAAAAGLPDLPGHLFELLRRVEAETSLRELGVPWAELSALLGDDLPSDLAARVFLGRDPAAPFAPVDVGLGAPGGASGRRARGGRGGGRRGARRRRDGGGGRASGPGGRLSCAGPRDHRAPGPARRRGPGPGRGRRPDGPRARSLRGPERARRRDGFRAGRRGGGRGRDRRELRGRRADRARSRAARVDARPRAPSRGAGPPRVRRGRRRRRRGGGRARRGGGGGRAPRRAR